MKSFNISKKMSGRFAATLATVLVAITLVACGGGGGGSPAVTPDTPVVIKPPMVTTPPVVTPPVATATGSVTKADSCTIPNGAATCSSLFSWTTASATAPTLKVGTTSVSTLAMGTNFAVNVGIGTFAVVLADRTTTLDASKSVTGSCVAGSVSTSGVCAPVLVCTAPAVLNTTHNICVTPMGVKVFGANQIPAGCTSWTQQCWRTASTDGTVKWVATSAIMTGHNTRHILHAYFKNASGFWNYLQFYSDTLSPTGDDISTGGLSAEIDWVYGNTFGIAAHDNSNALCVQKSWFLAPSSTWGVTVISCF